MSTFTGAVDDQALLREVLGFYRRKLQETPDALAWLQGHAITSPEIIERFHLGLSDRTLGLALPERNRKAGAEVRARLQRVGVLRPSGHEHFAGALVVPVFDAEGTVVQAYGRLIGASLRAGTVRDLYLPGRRRGVWNLAGLTEPEVVLCGGLLDALTAWSAGVTSVTAALSLDEVPAEIVQVLRGRGVRTVLVAYPRHEQGDNAADEATQALQAAGMTACRVELPGGVRVNELARRRGPAAVLDALGHARQRVPGTSVTESVASAQGAQGGAAPALGTIGPTPSPPPATTTAGTAPADATTDTAAAAGDHVDAADLVIELEDRRYRVRGLGQNASLAQLKVNLLVARSGEGGAAKLHVDTLDLYAANKRAAFARQASEELGVPEEVVRRDLAQVLLQAEQAQAEAVRRALQPKAPPVPALTAAEQAAALDLLRDEHLADRIVVDFERCGVVGERTNVLLGYLAAVSRKLDRPLAVVVQSSSAAGKTALLDAVLAFVPPEDRLQFSALTGQALYYLGASDIRHKVLAIAEDEGAERASYALKLLQSERELKIASTAKDSTGRLVAEEYVVRGPVAIFLTTTSVQVDEELLNRCIVLTVDEGREQTKAIHRLQREHETLGGLAAQEERQAILKLHQDAQRLLRPLLVANPYAPRLTFLDDRTRTRRDHMKYLALIRAVALLHQHQREQKRTTVAGREIEYVEATRSDIVLANKLADEVLGRSLDDLPPHTRRLLGLLHELVTGACAAQGMAQNEYRFTRKTVRGATGWGDTQLKIHLRRLVDLEHLVVHRSGRGHAYELVYDGRGRDGQRFLAGLLDPEKLVDAERSGSGRPSVGPASGAGRGDESGGSASGTEGIQSQAPAQPQNAQPAPASEHHVVPGHVVAGEGA
jgi:DNA primase